MTLVDHVEIHLGQIARGWSEGDGSGLRVLEFRNVPDQDAFSLLTLGLGEHILRTPKGKEIRHELLFSARGRSSSEAFVSLLLLVAESLLPQHDALVRGQVINLSEETRLKTGLEALYCAMPVLFDDALAQYNGTVPPTVIVWMLPIKREEAAFVHSQGWAAFEDQLESADEDLLSFDRESVLR